MNLVDSINRHNRIKKLEEENERLLAEYHRLRIENERLRRDALEPIIRIIDGGGASTIHQHSAEVIKARKMLRRD
jgi:regulator of replication initiation timing